MNHALVYDTRASLTPPIMQFLEERWQLYRSHQVWSWNIKHRRAILFLNYEQKAWNRKLGEKVSLAFYKEITDDFFPLSLRKNGNFCRRLRQRYGKKRSRQRCKFPLHSRCKHPIQELKISLPKRLPTQRKERKIFPTWHLHSKHIRKKDNLILRPSGNRDRIIIKKFIEKLKLHVSIDWFIL